MPGPNRPTAREDASAADERIAAARARLAAIDAALFPQIKPIPFYEQAVLVKRAVSRLLGDD
jgi:hypothetical protein